MGVLAVAASGAWATLTGVLAYESHIINVEASVANALNVPDVFNLGGESFSTSTPENVLFPQQFIVGSVSFGLSEEFKANPNVDGLTVDVYVHCKQDPEFLSSGGQWMGDATYMSTGPTGDPGPNDGTTAPPTTDLAQANNGWILIGGDPSACPTDAGGSPANLLKVFSSGTAIILDKSNLPASGLGSVHLGLDVPICEFNYNEATDPKPTEAGWSKPTLVIGSADPRFPDDGAGNVIDPDCNQRLGLDVKVQVVAIGATGGGPPAGGPPPPAPLTFLGPTPYLSQADSPFDLSGLGVSFFLEDFEDHLFDTPGVSGNGFVVGDVFSAFPGVIDSVDGDDGVINGICTVPVITPPANVGDPNWGQLAGLTDFCDSYSRGGSEGITFTFDEAALTSALGGFPTHVGIAWTDGDFGNTDNERWSRLSEQRRPV